MRIRLFLLFYTSLCISVLSFNFTSAGTRDDHGSKAKNNIPVKLPRNITFTYSVESPVDSGYFTYSIKQEGAAYKLYLDSKSVKKRGQKALTAGDSLNTDSYPKLINDVSKPLIESFCKAVDNPGFTTLSISNLGFSSRSLKETAGNFIKRNSNLFEVKEQKRLMQGILQDTVILNKKLNEYYKDQDEKNAAYRYTLKFSITLDFNDSSKTISTHSHKAFLIPWIIDGKNYYDPQISITLAKILNKTEIFNLNKWSGIFLYNDLAQGISDDNMNIIRNLAAHKYDAAAAQLQKQFVVSNIRIMEGVECINRAAGEEWFNCVLKDTSIKEDISIYYSNTIEKGKLKYSLSPVLTNGKELLARILKNNSISKFLNSNKSRKAAIHFDDEGALTEKVKGQFKGLEKHFDGAYLAALYDETGKVAYILIAPDNSIYGNIF